MTLLFSETPHTPVRDCITRTPIVFDFLVPIACLLFILASRPNGVARYFQLSEQNTDLCEKAHAHVLGFLVFALWILQFYYTIKSSSELNIENNSLATDICVASNQAMLLGSPFMFIFSVLAYARYRDRNSNTDLAAPLTDVENAARRLVIA